MIDDPTNSLLCDLIERRSVTPDDAGCQELIAARLTAAGFNCASMPFGEVSNLWARHGSDGPLFCLAGHTDVVPSGPVDAWQSDPFSPTVRDGNLYGRGAADMKSGVAAMVIAAEAFVARHPDHPGSLALLITSDEEGPARDGTLKVVQALNNRGENIDWCVLGEPSSAKKLADVVRIGRRGSLTGKLVVHGTQGHVAYPQLADNPIRRFAPVLAVLLEKTWDEGNADFPPTSFEVVELEAGAGAPNVIPGELRVRFNFRYSTEWTQQKLKAAVESIFDTFDFRHTLDWHVSGEPFLTQPGRLIDAVQQSIRETTGDTPELSTGGGTSDGRFISPAGAEVVELGPVNASIHKIDEHVDINDPSRLAEMYLRIAELLLI